MSEKLLKMYDISVDDFRIPLQQDIDNFERAVQAFGIQRIAIKTVLEVTLEMAQGKRPLQSLDNIIRNCRTL